MYLGAKRRGNDLLTLLRGTATTAVVLGGFSGVERPLTLAALPTLQFAAAQARYSENVYVYFMSTVRRGTRSPDGRRGRGRRVVRRSSLNTRYRLLPSRGL